MDRVHAQCRKCGEVFTTAAKTRTTCPGCKAAVTVRRDVTTVGNIEDNAASESSSWAGIVVVVASIALALWGGLRGGQR